MVVKKLMTLEKMMVSSLDKVSDGCEQVHDVGEYDGVPLEQEHDVDFLFLFLSIYTVNLE